MSRPPCSAHVLAGPTAVGKTGIAHHLALRDGYDILSADAMLVYRGMDIGTAKPTHRQQAEVRYFGMDLADPSQPFSVADYLTAVMAQLAAANPPPRRPLLVVGGTGLYIKALILGLDPGPTVDPRQRQTWETMARRGGVGALREALRTRAPAWLAVLPDPDNPRRLIRALEWVAAGFTTPPKSWQRQTACIPLVGLCMHPSTLRERIAERVQQMLAEGLWQEATALSAAGGLGRTARQAIGYAEALARLDGEISETEAVDRINARTRQLAKRQMTWFRHQLPVEWISLDGPRPINDIIADITRIWERNGPSRLTLPEPGMTGKAVHHEPSGTSP